MIFRTRAFEEIYTEDQNIVFYDWWESDIRDNWFVSFIRNKFPYLKRRINFYSTFGNGKFIKKENGIKIFFSAENLEGNKYFCKYYPNYCLDYVDLGLGYVNAENYLRFPGWIPHIFSTGFSKEAIIKRIEEVNKTTPSKKMKECVVIASHDKWRTRGKICDSLESILDIAYAGKWRNNTNELWNEFHNNKILYLKMFKFNICAENMNTEGYVTEKLFDAFLGKTIPIYFGSNNKPEPTILNKNAMIFWESEGDNRANIKLISELNTNEKIYNDFISQPKFLPTAVDYVYEQIENLYQKIKTLIE